MQDKEQNNIVSGKIFQNSVVLRYVTIIEANSSVFMFFTATSITL